MITTTAHVHSTQQFDPWKVWPATVRRWKLESEGVFTVDLCVDFSGNPPDSQPYSFLPGQFNMLYVPGVGESAISIAGQTSQGWLRHTIRSVGSVTQAIERAGNGMQLGLRGPFGRPWPVDLMLNGDSPWDVIIVAGGIGLAPLRALIEFVGGHRAQFGDVQVLLGARTPDDLLYRDQYEVWQEQHMQVETSVDRATADWTGHIGVVTLLLERLPVPRPQQTLVLTCGPEVMMRYVAKSAQHRGIPDPNMWVTLERNMNCAIGLCGHCQLGPKFICREGPVFRYDEVRSWLNVQDL